ncbi:uncharacterized protein si:dkey-195m11.11 [Erpetoichthys calabaricus]|uniref:uncharacterized protein si:dkey-195m11.11 n=1 Tax=Erpetoichthys calabaricus TaxID=27687 RepID=UPI002234A102|nr:uncharacterized protein si:dkey-195m11.11 [Erpetoichthys calabaricus]
MGAPHLLSVTALMTLLAVQCAPVLTNAVIPTPSLTLYSPDDPTKITLSSSVTLMCKLPRQPPSTVNVFFGRGWQPDRNDTIKVVDSNYKGYNTEAKVTLTVLKPEDESLYTCWFALTRDSSQRSEYSPPLNITASFLPPPISTISPEVIGPGQDYTIFCDTPKMFSNVTFLMYFHGNAYLMPYNQSVDLLDGHDRIYRSMKLTDDYNNGNYSCSFNVKINGRILKSPHSKMVEVVKETLPLRLVSDSTCAGRLEVFIRGFWGAVCDYNFDENSANVVCKILKCGQAVFWSYVQQSTFKPGTGPNALDKISCAGNESHLYECKTGAIRPYSSHNYDVGVMCSGFMPNLTISLVGYHQTSKQHIYLGSTIKLMCTLSGTQYSSSNTVWLAMKRIQQGSSYESTLTNGYVRVGETIQLTVDRVESRDEGIYKCTADINDFGSRLTVNSIPLTITVGKSYIVEICCAVVSFLIGAAILLYLCLCRTKS